MNLDFLFSLVLTSRSCVCRNATYSVGEGGRSVDRGAVEAIKKTGGLENTTIGHAIQVRGKVIELLKLVLVVILISGEDDPSSTTQAIVLLAITVAYIILLRVFRPPISR